MSIDELATSPERFLNRELSWLEFNSRVLAQAEDAELPLLERLKFCAIYASNLDEFFMVRVAGLRDQVAAGITRTPPDGLTPAEQLAEIRNVVSQQAHRLERIHIDRLQPALVAEGIVIANWSDLSAEELSEASAEFEARIFPVLTPLAVDPGHPFPYISGLSLNLAVLVSDPSAGMNRFARVKVPPMLPRFLALSTGVRVPLEQVIAAHLDQLFTGLEVLGAWPFRVTRNADLTLDDEEAEDLLEAVELELRRRRFGRAIRLEVDHTMGQDTLELLMRELDVDAESVYHYRGLLDATGLFEVAGAPRADLSIPSYSGATPPMLRDLENSTQMFDRLRASDIVLHHPYDSFASSVSEFVRQASLDPDVLAIKLTLYRTAGESPIIRSLIRAAERGKQVAVLVELKARFDEQANIEWAKRLEEAGVHVVYGLVGLKIHTKITLVVRNESGGLRSYCHIGTGNYNHKTAKIYEDLGILTADSDVGDDLTQLFNALTGYGQKATYDRLLVAPHTLRPSISSLIANETAAGPEGRIVIKMNSLVDADLIDQLYVASQAGVKVDLIIRGICCLRSGVPGMSDNITVRSLIGRYLEHSRVFFFANENGAASDCLGETTGETGPVIYVGSADLMPRNLDRRVEALVRVTDATSKERISEILEVGLIDNCLAWNQLPDGTYARIETPADIELRVNAHDYFERAAQVRGGLESPESSTGEPTVRVSSAPYSEGQE